jgi:hypothetical protein
MKNRWLAKLVLAGLMTNFVSVASAEQPSSPHQMLLFFHEMALKNGVDVTNPMWLGGASVGAVLYGGKGLWNNFSAWYHRNETKDKIEILKDNSSRSTSEKAREAANNEIKRMEKCISRFTLLRKMALNTAITGVGAGGIQLANHIAKKRYGTNVKGVEAYQEQERRLALLKLQTELLKSFSDTIAPQVNSVFKEFSFTILDDVESSGVLKMEEKARRAFVENLRAKLTDPQILAKHLSAGLKNIPAEITQLSPENPAKYLADLIQSEKTAPGGIPFKKLVSRIERELVAAVVDDPALPEGIFADALLLPATHNEIQRRIRKAILDTMEPSSKR